MDVSELWPYVSFRRKNTTKKQQDGRVKILQDVSGDGGNRAPIIQIGDTIHYACPSQKCTSPPSEISSPNLMDGEPLLNLKTQLQRFYRKATLPRVSWLDNGQDMGFSDYYVDLRLTASYTKLEINSIFEEINGQSPERILIEGQPGFGKTSLATKLMHDWATGEKYTRRFQLAFFISFRELRDRDRSVSQVMTDIAKLCGCDDEGLSSSVIAANRKDCLLVLDGYDELRGKSREHILEVLYQTTFSDSTVVVTCRTGLMKLEDEEVKRFSGGFTRNKEFYVKKITILGIGIEDRKKLLARFSSREIAEKIVVKLENSTHVDGEMFKSPLILIMLAFMAATNIIGHVDTDITGVYGCLVKSLVMYDIARKGGKMKRKFDFVNQSSNAYGKCLSKFGKLSLRLITENEFQIEPNELSRKIYDLGFLVKHESKTRFQTATHFEIFHFSFVEFFAALYISRKFQKKRKVRFSLLQIAQEKFFESGGTSLILPFLIGLMGKNSHTIFSLLTPNSYRFSLKQTYLWKLLLETESSEELLDSITGFIPPNVHAITDKSLNHFYANQLHDFVIRKGINAGRIHKISVPHGCDLRLPTDVQIPLVEIFINVKSGKSPDEYSLSKTKIKKLFVNFAGDCDTDQSEFVLNWMTFINSLSVQSVSIKQMESISLILIDNLEILDKINTIDCILDNKNPASSQLIRNLVTRNQLRNLVLYIDYKTNPSDINEIISLASRSEVLSSLQLENNSLDIKCRYKHQFDLNLLTNSGKKKWDRLILTRTKVTCGEDLKQIPHFNYLAADNLDEKAVKALSSANINAFHCISSMDMDRLNLRMVRELVVSLVFSPLENELLWSNLRHLTQLKVLAIEFRRETVLPICQVIRCLKQLTHFEILKADLAPKSVGDLVKCFPVSTVRTLNVQWSSVTCDLDAGIVLGFVECVRKGTLKEVGIVSNDVSYITSLLFNLVDVNVFKIEHGIHGCRDDDPEFWKWKYNNSSLYHKLTIVKRV